MYRLEFILALLVVLSLIFADTAQGEDELPTATPAGARGAPDAAAEESAQNHREREGTRLSNQQGYFRGSGDGFTFHLRNSEEKYSALENLALERVGKVMSDRHDHPDQLNWNVSGFFTEYRGGNYLFITHVVLENKNRRRSALP